ncbi:MAG: hypothetical protein HOL23_06765 [Gammaproteobacteria bacterium]|jgi:hypothetical protein|nr:hypothetical protein [Gammaproteobacteria bacterium]
MALRATVYDHFIWTLICPFIAGFILFQIKLKRFLFNKLDRLIIYYLCYGVLLLLIGLVVSPVKINIVRTFVHMYLPALSYIIARYYFNYSFNNILIFTNILILLTSLIILDIFIEYIFIENNISQLIPWIKKGQIAVAKMRIAVGQFYNYPNPISFISVMGGGKTVALFVSSMFCFIMPFAILKANQQNLPFFIFKRSITVIILSSLFIQSFILPSLSSTLSLIFVFGLIVLLETGFNNLRPILVLIIISMIIIFFLKDFFIDQYILRVKKIEGGSTQIAYIFNILNTFLYYSNADILAYVFGGDIFPSSLASTHKSELTLLLMPLRYSVLWALLIGMILLTIIKYCRFLIIRHPINNINRTLGLAFMGFFIVYITNLHYPSFNLHGNIELFFIMAAALSTSYEYACKEIQYSSNKGHA